MSVAVTYCYDGTFDGLMCCVFESYAQKEIPLDILSPEAAECTLLPLRNIPNETEKARRVLASVPAKIGIAALDFIQQAFLTCFGQKELYILLFLRKGYSYGPRVMEMLADHTVNTLFKAVRHLERESHLFKGFIRFSEYNKVLVAEIEPKNDVLPLLASHFCQRYPEERFLIYDTTHGRGLVYQPNEVKLVQIEGLELPEAEEAEERYRSLWQLFYETIEIKERHNPKCRSTQMPKRYWKYMTEFSERKQSVRKLKEENT